MKAVGTSANLLELRASKSEEPIFILSCSQRTGSTLLLRLLNSHPDIMLWGEHGGSLHDLLASHDTIANWRASHPVTAREFIDLSGTTFIPNAMPSEALLGTAIRAYLSGIFPVPSDRSERCRWGFKEVRYGAPIALFLQKLYPKARFIHLVRRLEDCILSMRKLEETKLWERQWTDEAVISWISCNKSFLEMKSQISHYFLLRYEDLTGADALAWIAGLERFLGLGARSLNASILGQHVDFVPRFAPTQSLSEEELALLHQPDVAQLLSDYGY